MNPLSSRTRRIITSRARSVATVLALVGAGTISAAALAQAATRNSWQGVFTVEQAERGKAAYEQRCAVCHGPNLAGADVVPALTGATFASNWNGTSGADLFNRIHDTMPMDDPGSLSGAQTSDITAFIFQSNGFPAGATVLPNNPTALGRIRILSTKPAE